MYDAEQQVSCSVIFVIFILLKCKTFVNVGIWFDVELINLAFHFRAVSFHYSPVKAGGGGVVDVLLKQVEA